MDTVPAIPLNPPPAPTVSAPPPVPRVQPVAVSPPNQLKPTSVRPIMVVLAIAIGVFLIAIGAYVIYYHNLNNRITIKDQQIGKSVQFDKIVVGYSKGAMVVIQRSSSFASGKRIANSGLIPPGTYINAGIDLAKPDEKDIDNTPIEPGEYLYAVLYGETDDIEGLTKGDTQLKNLFGQYSVARFRAQ